MTTARRTTDLCWSDSTEEVWLMRCPEGHEFERTLTIQGNPSAVMYGTDCDECPLFAMGERLGWRSAP